MIEFIEIGGKVVKNVFIALKWFTFFLVYALLGLVQIFMCRQWQRLFTFLIIIVTSNAILDYTLPRPYLFGGYFQAGIANLIIALFAPFYLFLVYKKGDIK